MGEFEARYLFDLSLNYEVPIWRQMRPRITFDVPNVLNHQPLMRHSVAVTADFDGPVDEHGSR